MNCDILREDINKLKTLRDQFEQKANTATETGTGKIETISIQKEAEQESDQLLEKYLDDFFDKNPDLLQFTLGKRIEGFESEDGQKAGVLSMAPLPNGNILIGGSSGALYECQKQLDGFYKLCSRIPTMETDTSISSIAPLPNGDMLIGSGFGLIYEYQHQPDGSYKLKSQGHSGIIINTIAPLPNGNMLVGGGEGDSAIYEYPTDNYQLLTHQEGDNVNIKTIAPLANGNMLIGGSIGTDGVLYEYQEQSDGYYYVSDAIATITDKWGGNLGISAIAPLPNGNMLIGCLNGALYEYQQRQNGSYELSGQITGFKDGSYTSPNSSAPNSSHINARPKTSINTIAPLPNGNLLIGGRIGENGALCEYQKQPDGSYEVGSNLLDPGFYPIQSISSLPNGNILVGGAFGELLEFSKSSKSLEILKQSLDKIINK